MVVFKSFSRIFKNTRSSRDSFFKECWEYFIECVSGRVTKGLVESYFPAEVSLGTLREGNFLQWKFLKKIVNGCFGKDCFINPKQSSGHTIKITRSKSVHKAFRTILENLITNVQFFVSIWRLLTFHFII